ncbi:hypothetical protein SK128_021516 [Halocaridina rubra]|uniref:C2H2-type domain-containing protein n=1 Tax=Halocaridina rubra TaxID=373956 RepID=A0AAN9A8G5_HALRR
MESNVTDSFPYRCTKCVQVFTTSESLVEHEISNVCNESLVCNICDKVFPTIGKLKSHKRGVHTTERSHECPLCQRLFSDKSNLGRHIQRHNGERSYVCSICGKTFTTNSNLSTHLKVHSAREPLMCVLCNNTFLSKHGLKKHMMTHSGERPFQCEICDASFKENYSLKTHMKQHDNKDCITVEKPYQCGFCGKRLKFRRSLNRHLMSSCKSFVLSKSENEKPYENISCDSFDDSSNNIQETDTPIKEDAVSDRVFILIKSEKDAVDSKSNALDYDSDVNNLENEMTDDSYTENAVKSVDFRYDNENSFSVVEPQVILVEDDVADETLDRKYHAEVPDLKLTIVGALVL